MNPRSFPIDQPNEASFVKDPEPVAPVADPGTLEDEEDFEEDPYKIIEF